jgi:guanyl-specific ribonuclease Sa
MMSGTVRRIAWILLAVVLAVAAAALIGPETRGRVAVAPPASSPSPSGTAESGGSAPPIVASPGPRVQPDAVGQAAPAGTDRAREMLAALEGRGGAPLPGYVGGREFHNRERRLPAGRYREYDIRPRVAGQDRGPERLVVNRDTGRAYYTADHYRTFVPLN